LRSEPYVSNRRYQHDGEQQPPKPLPADRVDHL
jgi:hypothetical protein